MPIYEYRCHSCGKIFEYMQRITEEPIRVCEACGGELERLISQTAFQLKGSGWYKDLYSSPKKEAAGGSTAGDAKPAASTGGDGGGSTGGSSSSDSGASKPATSKPAKGGSE